jgi:hypothetical protein
LRKLEEANEVAVIITHRSVLLGLLRDSLLEVVGELDHGAGQASHAPLGDGGGNLIDANEVQISMQ